MDSSLSHSRAEICRWPLITLLAPKPARGVVTIWLALSVILLTLAAAPYGQWYLAWIGMVPWLIVVGRASTVRKAALLGWLSGVFYFAVNLWWLWTASVSGTVVLVVYLALYWGLAGALIRGFRLLDCDAGNEPSIDHSPTSPRFRAGWIIAYGIIGIAVVWTATEWLRGNLVSGLPWMPLGVTQSPFVAMCQVADMGGPWIVSFWVVLPNALAAVAILQWHQPRKLVVPCVVVATMLIAVAVYGSMRLVSAKTVPGPRIMVVQSNFPHLPGGAPTIERQQAADFYISQLERSLEEHQVDLVMMPEAAFPPINEEARRELARTPVGSFLEETHRQLISISERYHTALLLGGAAVTGWKSVDGERIGAEIRNSAYFIDASAGSSVQRYDKVHLVPFSERPPSGPKWLRRLGMAVAASRAAQPLHAGDPGATQVFYLRPGEIATTGTSVSASADGATGNTDRATVSPTRATRFISPICLENIDPAVVASMLRGQAGEEKRADFIANVSNDGWFATVEKYQHLQTLIFRCIENRVPMARSSNTGISGFIDSSGRINETLDPNTSDVLVWQIRLDHRRTLYTQYGDVFAVACVCAVALGLCTKILVRLGVLPAKTGRGSEPSPGIP